MQAAHLGFCDSRGGQQGVRPPRRPEAVRRLKRSKTATPRRQAMLRRASGEMWRTAWHPWGPRRRRKLNQTPRGSSLVGLQLSRSRASSKMSVKMGNVVTDYQKARAMLRLGSYERWQVECIVNLLIRHDDRVLAQRRLRIDRRKSAAMLARQDAGRRVSSIPPYGWTTDPVRPWRLTPQPEEQQVRQRILRDAADGKTFRAIARGLNAAGVPCRSGRAWSHQTVGAIVRRAAHKW